MKNEPPQHHRYDNLATENGHHYQNHFFATIYDSDGANGGPEFFERQNSNGGSFERQSSLGEPEVIIREKVGFSKHFVKVVFLILEDTFHFESYISLQNF